MRFYENLCACFLSWFIRGLGERRLQRCAERRRVVSCWRERRCRWLAGFAVSLCWVSLKPPPCGCCSNPRPADSAPGAGADWGSFGEAASLALEQDLFQALGSDLPEARAATVSVVMGVQHRSLSAPQGGRVTVVCSVMGCVRGAPPSLLVLSWCCVFPGFVVVCFWFFFPYLEPLQQT